MKQSILRNIVKAICEADATFVGALQPGKSINKDQYGSDDTTTKDIKNVQAKYVLPPLVDKLLAKETLTSDEIAQFKNLCDGFDGLPFYTVESKEELAVVLKVVNENIDQACNFNWIDLGLLTDLSYLFANSNIGFGFQGDISRWDVSRIKNMKEMFAYSQFNGDLSKWDVSNVKDMSSMFWYSSFNGDISTWDIVSVQNMSQMFLGAAFNGDISGWDTGNVEDMFQMFAWSSFNGDISDWDVSNVSDLSGMFKHNKNFNQDISSWQIKPSANINEMFYMCNIEPEFRCSKSLSEAVSNFNLRKGTKLHNDEFDDDEVSATQIENTAKKYKQKALVTKLLDGTINDDELDYFRFTYFTEDNNIQYKVNRTNELKVLINACLNFFGNECNLNWIDVSEITDLTYHNKYYEISPLFEYSKFNGDISKWNVSNVTNMFGLFRNSKFNGDISNWDVSLVTDMSEMFSGSVFDKDLSMWDVSSVKDMSSMFNCSAFNGDISAWDVSSVKDMGGMFSGSKFNGDISNWNVSKVTNMYMMFDSAPFTGDISRWDVSKVKDMGRMFRNTTFNGDINEWNVSRVKNMAEMFASSVFTGDISNWDVSRVTDMSCMFKDSIFNGDISNWNVGKVKSMANMFNKSSFNRDISDWNISNVKGMYMMFTSSEFNQDLSTWELSDDVAIDDMFEHCPIKKEFMPKILTKPTNSTNSIITDDDINDNDINLDPEYINDFIQKSVIDMLNGNISESNARKFIKYLKYFKYCPLFATVSTTELFLLINASIKYFGPTCNLNWIDVRSITNMSRLFMGPNSIFNGDISEWDVSNVTNMSWMFAYSYFNGDISNWDTHSVTNMSNMFIGAKFNRNISNWDVSNVKNMHEMFAFCPEFNLAIGNWNVCKVKKMNSMFNCAFKFNKDISKWDIKNASKENMFDSCPIKEEFKPKSQISEAVSNFNLRKGAKVNDVDFDNDEVSTEDILRTEAKYRLQKLIPKLLDGSISPEEADYFNVHCAEFDDKPFYKTDDIRELIATINNCITHLGENCNLNWIDVSDMTNLSWLFCGADTRYNLALPKNYFNGDISKWDVSNVKYMSHMFWKSVFNGDISDWDVSNVIDMDYMFAYSQFNQDISNWDINPDAKTNSIFANYNERIPMYKRPKALQK